VAERFTNQKDFSSMLLLIQGLKRNDRNSQRLLYQHYYGFAMGVCLRYCRTSDEAKEVLNDGFMKVFGKIDQYNIETSFHGWLKKILINTAIDHYRKEKKHYNHDDLDSARSSVSSTANALDQLAHHELMGLVQKLSPAYRTVFNMYVIDGYTHDEIATILNISEGTSKSNLSKARENLKKMLETMTGVAYAKSI
jgi:RNA polymerase sigma factor (sigma-70 family)